MNTSRDLRRGVAALLLTEGHPFSLGKLGKRRQFRLFFYTLLHPPSARV